MRVRRRPVRLFWHDLLGVILDKRRPSDTTVTPEVAVSRQAQRADFVLSRKRRRRRPKRAWVLRGLFRFKFIRALIEFKSKARPFAPGDLHGLVGRGAQYYAHHRKELRGPKEFAQFLLVPSLTPALRAEVRELEWSLEAISTGYWRVKGAPYTTIVAALEVVADAEHDDLLRVLGSCKIEELETVDFLLEEAGLDLETSMARINGYTELAAKLAKNERISSSILESLPLAKRLKGVSAEELLKGVSAEERLKGVSAEERLKGVSAQKRLKGVSAQERLKGLPAQERLKGLPAEERLKGIEPEDLARAVSKLPRKARQHLADALARSQRT